MRALWLIFAALALLLSAPLPMRAQSQMELNEQAGKRLEKADAELNKVYKQVLAQQTDEPEFAAISDLLPMEFSMDEARRRVEAMKEI